MKTCTIAVFIAAVMLVFSCSKSDKSAVVAKESLPSFVQQLGDRYVIQQGNIKMEISPNDGGRISSLKIGYHELLVTSNHTNSTLWGSVLWPSPQSDWSWPPVETLDAKPYRLSVDNDRLVLTSDVDQVTGYQFVKSYGISSKKNNALSVIYSIYNRSHVAKTVAPWELTRVYTRGMVAFPGGEGELESGIFYPMNVPLIDDIRWFLYDEENMRDDHHKMMADGREGWIAYIDKGHLLVKEFDDVPAEFIAEHEGEIELFADLKKTYLEIQQQGSMTRLQPGEHLEWEVIWHVRKLPADIPVAVGSQELVNFIRYLVSRPE